jgi:hypothetical protein
MDDFETGYFALFEGWCENFRFEKAAVRQARYVRSHVPSLAAPRSLDPCP